MNTITKIVVLLSLCFMSSQMNAQDTLKIADNQFQIDKLELLKEAIKNEEREYLKVEVEAINQRLEKGEITETEAEDLKKEAAKKRALNIENRLAIIDNKIALMRRNGTTNYDANETKNAFSISIGEGYRGIKIRSNKKLPKYDTRTTNELLFAIGFNNALIDGESFSDSPYKLGGSGFVELGWNWKTRILKNSNFMRVKYGFSFQWNKLNPKDDQYFVQNGDVTTLEEFSTELRKSEFRVTNLVFPVYLEFGPSRKLERDTHIRYINNNKFKFGIGGYAGFNIGTQQKLRYKEDGENVKQKTRKDFNTSDFVYGLGAYVGIGEISLYAKYDLNPMFKDQAVDQNNLSLGLRFDL
jgi:hypothetical protein